ncbi:MAG: hypothetical protein HY514_01980 [Candidatus Aenigmarchaeota archaeon]|nr:hypothetical protein [Candidatus Aenigmarchaeota archaeon]
MHMHIGTYSTTSAENYSFIRCSDVLPSRLNFTTKHAHDLHEAFSGAGTDERLLRGYIIENNNGQINTWPIITHKKTSGQKYRKRQANPPIGAPGLVGQASGICGLLFSSNQMKIIVLRVQGYGVTPGTIPTQYGRAVGPVKMPLDGVGAAIYTRGREFEQKVKAAAEIFDKYFLTRQAKEKETLKKMDNDAEEFFKTARELNDRMTGAEAFRDGLEMGKDGVERHWARFLDHYYNLRLGF